MMIRRAVVLGEFDDCQNPLYPRDKDLTIEQTDAMARECSMMRARSPGERVCKVDHIEDVDEPGHTHDYATFMQWRHDNVIGDQDPWAYWLTFDQWADFYHPPLPPAPQPAPLGWFPRARVNPLGIPTMNAQSGPWQGLTFVSLIGPSRFQKIGPGADTRVTFSGDYQVTNVFIGPMTPIPWIASSLHSLTFGGALTGNTTWPTDQFPYQLISDPLPMGIDATNGVLVSGFIIGARAHPPNAILYYRTSEADWASSWTLGDHSADLDKSKTSPTGKSSDGWVRWPGVDFSVLIVEGFYPPA